MASAFRQGRAAGIANTISNDEVYDRYPEVSSSKQFNGISIELEAVSKQFGHKKVLEDIHISLEPGSFVAIVGRSGCGKSTLLRLLSGLDQVSSGSLKLQDKEVKGVHHDTRFMFQDARLLPWNTVLDNVKLGLTGVHSAEAHRRAFEALKLVGLEDRAEEWPSVLSGGQRQRVALARALVGNPHLLLFDEPLGALDALTRIEMQRLIEDLWEQRGFTAIMVTHDVSEAVSLTDRVILIENGKIALDIKITLPRPRIRDAGFAHFEQVILDRVLTPDHRAEARSTASLYDI
ncbi:sulfonate transport system ATP-binding protein [Fontibacillus panacisegetis]|uniref:Sulfonate transport system ATP-binding protein n=1 Tax=Fontibacillus panacisegetis TaxID=670482 RepID=A0A1G7V0C8_9BACL|nr:ATP-binding cassette domain-containing protein [Fontibacillus panacisegetis]SDG53207.1 sulfonate transport system ATP-binding protein [Fontibacillus panacisegetis]